MTGAQEPRLNVMTGIHRRDVNRIVEGGESEWKPAQSLATRVLGQWEQDITFQTKAGKPRQLYYEGEDSEFEHLVHSVSKEIGPKAILAELERLGSVERHGNRLKLVETMTIRNEDPKEGLNLLVRDLCTYTNAVEENIFRRRSPRNHHNRTEYDRIYVEDLPKVRAWLYEQGAKFHFKLRSFLAKHDAEITPNSKKEKKGTTKVAFLSASWTER